MREHGTAAGVRLLETAAAMRDWSREFRRRGRLALVPTMGALHQGHRALFRAASRAADATVASIYVNPAQFGPGEDLERYPQPLAQDLEACAAEGVAAVFLPGHGGIYPADHSTWVEESDLSRPMEGECRPGHFRGVLTVVLKLLHICEPDVVLLGQKDAQQALLVRRLIRDLDLPVQIRIIPTVRDADGLALSSRNAYLSPAEREAAPALFLALGDCAARLERGELDPGRIRQAGLERLRRVPGIQVEYLEVVDLQLLRATAPVAGPVLVAGAIRAGATRLIDNLIYPPAALAELESGAD